MNHPYVMKFVGRSIRDVSKQEVHDIIHACTKGTATVDEIKLLGRLLNSHIVLVNVPDEHQMDLFETMDYPMVISIPRSTGGDDPEQFTYVIDKCRQLAEESGVTLAYGNFMSPTVKRVDSGRLSMDRANRESLPVVGPQVVGLSTVKQFNDSKYDPKLSAQRLISAAGNVMDDASITASEREAIGKIILAILRIREDNWEDPAMRPDLHAADVRKLLTEHMWNKDGSKNLSFVEAVKRYIGGTKVDFEESHDMDLKIAQVYMPDVPGMTITGKKGSC